MNKKNELLLQGITTRARQYSAKVTDILTGYNAMVKKTREEGKIRKDEETFVAENTKKHSEAARRLLAAEASAFAADVRHSAEELKDQLVQTLFRPMNQALLQRLTVMHEFGIAPSRLELETMLDQNAGNLLGLKSIDTLLTKTKASYKLVFYDASTYENDLNVIESLARDADHFVPTEMHSAGCDVYRGQPQTIKRPDGIEAQTGATWDSIALLMRNTAITSATKKIEEMTQRWSADISTSIMDSASAAVKAEEAEQARIEGKPIPAADPASTATIEKRADAAIEFAREVGKQNAKAIDTLQAGHYAR